MPAPISTAIIPIGGLGTRFFPLTKTLPKYLLPVYDRPVLDYLLDNCVEAGIHRIIFVTAAGDTQVRHYLSEDLELYRDLCARGKEALYSQKIAPLHKRVDFVVLEQAAGGPYGPAAAMMHARSALHKDEPFVFMMGDDFLWRKDQGSDLLDMIQAFEQSDAAAACLVERVTSFESLRRNAAVTLRTPNKSGFTYMKRIIEKPDVDIRPRLASIGRYIFNPGIFDIIGRQPLDKRSSELHLSDTLDLLCKDSLVLVHIMQGRQLDCGTPDNWLRSNNFIARSKK